ncbi:Type III restriction enzyme [Candidatus Methylobacter favarea]|uniref:Type III restriction enzyme n=1 Tax=Candidatus Methylobacter favarea TaxID=2707345 RepID=A0A8S0Y5V9_9GAMM|nr:DEAD/DEAH box helicase family protein [Candidatus Methylobacter favarea]CAA9889900.1 Type III restriction enzyme [Candidatus Methylobacter favarea]
MKLMLKEFQEDTLTRLIKSIRQSKYLVKDGNPQAIVLSSPTGSGKTVIVAALIETIFQGADEIFAEPDAVFLWLSDQPELNEQSRRKIALCSSRLREADLVVIDSDFDQEIFDGGKVYFLNTQKLGKDKNLVKIKGDNRQFTIWETIQKTQDVLKDKFYLIIDEAHRGMNQSSTDANAAKTIVQQFVFGNNELPAIQLILGVSATPKRFQDLLQDAQHYHSRIQHSVTVNPEDVTASGLLKDKIVLYHPLEEQASDWSLLAAAVRQWLKMCDKWSVYVQSQGIAAVKPIMVIQVEDGNESTISKTPLGQIIAILETEIGTIQDDELAHSFQEDKPLSIGDRKIRKIDASLIQEDDKVKFVLFKMSLTTGWDCPRAEVMMSFRKAIDHTLIAQLIGRMVRTPLARRIENQEFLNSVFLYLPHYDQEGLKKVIENLKSDPESVPPTDVVEGAEQVTLYRSTEHAACFDALQAMPSYRVERIRKTSDTRRLMRLARLLTAIHNFDPDALPKAKQLILGTLKTEIERLQQTDGDFAEKLRGCHEIAIQPVTVDQGRWTSIVGEAEKIPLSDANIEQLFQRAGQRLGEGLHIEYWKEYYDANEPQRPKLELFLALQQQSVWEALEKRSLQQFNDLLNQNHSKIGKLTSAEREKYNKLKVVAKDPELIDWELPDEIIVNRPANAIQLNKHLYLPEDGKYSSFLNEWEKLVIKTEIAKQEVVAWLRNESRKQWSFCLPYEHQKSTQAMFPDFLVIRHEQAGGYIIDILEPHNPDYDDNAAKAVGLAKFASKHWSKFGRIELIRVEGTHIKRLDVNDNHHRENVLRVNGNPHLDALFAGL